MKLFVFILVGILLVGCVPNDSKISVNFNKKNNVVSPSQVLSANVSSVQIVDNQLVINGNGLSDVTNVKVDGTSFNELFSIESKSATKIIANSVRAFSFDVSKVFNVILSDANASATFPIDFSLCNATLNGKGFDCAAPISDKDVLSYDAVSGTWKPRAVTGLNYLGAFNASSNPATGPAIQPAGAYYIISASGMIATIPFTTGDWLVSNGSSWQKIDNSTAVVSVFGRNGIITAQAGDYNLDMLGDISFPTAPVAGKVLKFNGTHWVAGDDLSGGGAGSVTAAEIADGAVTDAKIDTVSASKITGTITSAQVVATTAAADTNTTQLATTAFVVGQASSLGPVMNGVQTVGTSLKYSREDHIHPTDTSRAPAAGSASITTLGTITAGVWNGTTIALANGGTGATTAAGARSNLGLGTAAVANTGSSMNQLPLLGANATVGSMCTFDLTLGFICNTAIPNGDASTSNPLSQFAATTSAQLAGVLSDETGTGLAVFNTAPTFATNLTAPLIIGGTATTSSLTYKTTSGVGTTGADHIFQVGNNGATEAMRILNSGKVGIGTTTAVNTLSVYAPYGVANNSGSFANGGFRLMSPTDAVVLDMGIGINTTAWLQARDPSNYATTKNMLLNPVGGNVTVGGSNTSIGLSTSSYVSANGVFGVVGNNATSASSFGITVLANNRTTPATGDTAGELRFSMNNNTGHRDLAYIMSKADGAGGANGFGGNLIFSVKSDNVSTAPPERMRITSNGYVGIGTSTPTYPLHVVGTANNATTSYWNWGDGSTSAIASTSMTPSVSIYASGQISASVMVLNSDARIKNIIGRSDSASDLEKLLQIQITDYKYIDKLTNGGRSTKKVIAQEVEKILPNYVTRRTDFIPNVYRNADRVVYSQNKTILYLDNTEDLKVGDKIKIYSDKNEEGQVKVVDVNSMSVTVEKLDLSKFGKNIFVYGKEVDDFRAVDYEAIAMLNVSATQELSKKMNSEVKENLKMMKVMQTSIEVHDRKIASLENENKILKEESKELREKSKKLQDENKEIRDRLSRLEKILLKQK